MRTEIDDRAITPSRLLYAIPVLALLAGVALCIFTISRSTQQTRGTVTRVVMPGTQDIDLPSTGTYTVFYEYVTMPGDTTNTAIGDAPDLKLAIASTTTEQHLALSRATSQISYPVPGRKSVSVYQFQVAQPGQYAVTAERPSGQKDPPFVLSITHGVVGQLVGHVLVGFGFVVAGIAIAGATTAILFFMRQSAAKRIRLGLN